MSCKKMLVILICLLTRVSVVNKPDLVTIGTEGGGTRRRGLFSSTAMIFSRYCVVPGIGAEDFGAMVVMDLVEESEPKLRPNGSKEDAVAESLPSDFGFEVAMKGSWTFSIAPGVGLVIE
jgi:hypothetical protein